MPESPSQPPRRRWRKLIRTALVGGLAAVLTIAALVLIWFRSALYHRYISFPAEEAAWQSLRAQRIPVKETAGWNEYRGVLHSHSHFSHDSEVSFETIHHAMEVDGLDFICLSDHCIKQEANFDWQWRGLHDGKLFIPGFEMKDGIMPFGVASGVVLSNTTDNATLARQIVDHGGVLFYAHPEERRDWDRPELTGMEIYNIHTDFKRPGHSPVALLPDVILSLDRYPEHLYYRMFHRPTEFLQHWDELNRTRHITGIAGNDCHQNVGLRGFYTTNDTIRVEDTSPKTVHEFQLNSFTRLLAKLAWGSLTPGRRLFHIQLDPYERSAHFVNTHVLAKELNEPAILDSLRAGRVFVGFDVIADTSGFRWYATNAGKATAAMGEPLPFGADARLHAVSPLPCRYTIVRDGSVVLRSEGRSMEWTPPGPGKYRVEAELLVNGEWVPWIYANPIELK